MRCKRAISPLRQTIAIKSWGYTYIVQASNLPPEDFDAFYRMAVSGQNPVEFFRNLSHRDANIPSPAPIISGKQKQKKPDDKSGIKMMPEYDPDAGLNSLSMTIHVWISSMERTLYHGFTKETSTEAKEKLLKELQDMTTMILYYKNTVVIFSVPPEPSRQGKTGINIKHGRMLFHIRPISTSLLSLS